MRLFRIILLIDSASCHKITGGFILADSVKVADLVKSTRLDVFTGKEFLTIRDITVSYI